MMWDLLTALFLLAGAAFFFAGTIGLLRFRNVHGRLHALSKADNLGLGLISLGLMLQAEGAAEALKIFAIWLLALLASALNCFVIAEWEIRHGSRDRGV